MNIADAIARHARENPYSAAILAGDRIIDFRKLDAAIDRVAVEFYEQGLRSGATVGISIPASPLHLITVYALARLGVVHLTLPVQDSAAARGALAFRFGVQAIVSDRPQNSLTQFTLVKVDPAWLAPATREIQPVSVRTHGGTPWKIVLSSGTTAAPKAVLATHETEFGWHSRGHPPFPVGSRFLSTIDMNFSYGLRLNMQALNSGACVVLTVAGNARALFDEIDIHGITHLAATPRHLMDALPDLPLDAPRCPNIRYLSVAGSIMPEKLRQQIRRRMTPNLHVKYGSNEVGYVVEAPPELQDGLPDVLGRAVAGVQYEIVDDQGSVVPPGDVGRIRFRGEAFPPGYADNPEATAAAFADGWFAPGDLARVGTEGEIYFMGRADDMINFDGVKLYPADIESCLLRHEAVVEAAAFAMPSERFQDVPAAAVVLRPDCLALATKDLIIFCNQHLGLRAPRVVHVVSALPKNAMGKVLKKDLARMLMAAMERPPGTVASG